MDIGKGDWVECVSEWPPVTSVHSVYIVEEVGNPNDFNPCAACGSLIALALRGVPIVDGMWWCGNCEMRPIYRPKHSFENLLKAPAPKTPVTA